MEIVYWKYQDQDKDQTNHIWRILAVCPDQISARLIVLALKAHPNNLYQYKVESVG